jgi:6-phosphogluconolactonase
MKVEILPDLETLSRKAAEIFLGLSEEYIARKGRFAVAVSGGCTPIRLYSLLGSEDYRERIDWRYVHFFWADERFVPHDHTESNYRVLKENLLGRIPIPSENVHAVGTDESSISTSVRTYENEIKQFFKLSENKLPEFDLILLGMGEDGHTASLFTGTEVLKEKDRLVASVRDHEHNYPRITLTLPVINKAENIAFLISGKNKASVVKKVIQDKDACLPASLVEQEKGNLFFLLDKDAGMFLLGKV